MQVNPTAALVTPTKQTRTIFHTTRSDSTTYARPYNHYGSLKTVNKITMRAIRVNQMKQQ